MYYYFILNKIIPLKLYTLAHIRYLEICITVNLYCCIFYLYLSRYIIYEDLNLRTLIISTAVKLMVIIQFKLLLKYKRYHLPKNIYS